MAAMVNVGLPPAPEPKVVRLNRREADDAVWRPNKKRMALSRQMGYTIEKTLGGGAFSKVKEATNAHNDKVAIKIINKTRAPKEYLEKFLPREVEILQKLKHPNMAQLYDAIESSSNCYLVFEHLPNGDLLEYINQRGNLSEGESRRLFKQLLNVVGYCHDNGVIHRDIKVDNLLMDENNNIKITDFGFATFSPEKQALETYCGSYTYAAPEVVEGAPYDGRKADIWSMGVCLFAMLNGKVPFKDDSLDILIHSMRRPVVFYQKVSKECREFVRSMLRIGQDERATIDKLRKHLWLSMPIKCDDASNLVGTESMSTLASYTSSAGGSSRASSVLDGSAEHGFACSQNIPSVDRAPTRVSDMLKAVVVRRISISDESNISLTGKQIQIISPHHHFHQDIGVAGPVAKKISQEVLTSAMSSVNPRQFHRSISTGVPANNRPSFDRRLSVPHDSALRFTGSVVSLPEQCTLDSAIETRLNDTKTELDHLHQTLGSKVAVAAGKERQRQANCKMYNVVMMARLLSRAQAGASELNPIVLGTIDKWKARCKTAFKKPKPNEATADQDDRPSDGQSS